MKILETCIASKSVQLSKVFNRAYSLSHILSATVIAEVHSHATNESVLWFRQDQLLLYIEVRSARDNVGWISAQHSN